MKVRPAFAIPGFAFVAAGALLLVLCRSPAGHRDLRAARSALASGRFVEAERFARNVLAVDGSNIGALLIAGESATRLERYDEALRYYLRAQDDSSPEFVTALVAASELERHVGRLSHAEELLRRALEKEPENAFVHSRLAFVHCAAGRRWESVPHLLMVVRSGEFSFQELLLLANTERLLQHADYLAQCRKNAPNDRLTLLAAARADFASRKYSEARTLLERAVAADPHLVEAKVQLGWLLLETGDVEEFLKWHAAIGPMAEAHPEFWALRGRWLQDQGEYEGAIYSYWECVRRDPDHRVAVHQLGQLLRLQGRTGEAQPFVARAERLQKLAELLDELERARTDVWRVRLVAEEMRELGRLWEAAAWAQIGSSMDSKAAWASALGDEVADLLPQRATGRTVDPERLWARIRIPQTLPVPLRVSVREGLLPDQIRRKIATIRFRDMAAAAGIDFTYYNSHEPASAGMRMFEFTGGGVAVIDFDRDGWADLYFTQGCEWPVDELRKTHCNQLFRNQGDGRARRVTDQAGAADNRYSQGAGVGDINEDGFPDLYVANIGLNRLYLNCGDGTFIDATMASGLTASVWTTSCALADVNGDGFADLYDVNYLSGEGVFSRICQKDGMSRSCSPTEFAAEQDQLWLSRGDGTFHDVTVAAGVIDRTGNGLGVVIADLDNDSRLDIFVANDATANFLFTNSGDGPVAAPRFANTALLAGVAFDGQGRAQACMGIACGDSDGDGRTDLFVTNFYHEANTLYRQLQPGVFVDDTAPAGLKEPGFDRLGFGTQFLDADLDGRPELVVANGHVDDFSYEGTPFRMRPQLFYNIGEGQFLELFPDSLGPWFAEEQLGRGLARVDWNRDGRDDFAVSHLDTPAALVLNETRQTGRWVRFSFNGVHSARDAIGTIVTGRVGTMSRSMQLTAGDGYQASNERCLTFGLDSADTLDDVVVRWPGGHVQVIGRIAADAEYVLVEGRPPLRVRRAAESLH